MGDSDHHVLDLGLGLTQPTTNNYLGLQDQKKQPPTYSTTTTSTQHHQAVMAYEPSLTLSLSGKETLLTSTPSTTTPPPPKKIKINAASYGYNNNKSTSSTEEASPHCNSVSAASSLSNTTVTAVKRERDIAPTISEEVEADKILSSRRGGSGGGGTSDDGEEEEGNTRKKLRLTKEQSALLEESFKQHSTLNPKQKQALANQLSLRPRQVEVWFQNRRARTKLKQTEVDCEFLRKCCESLTDENRRLQKELQELKALKLAQPLYMHLPPPTLTMCPSCERIDTGPGASTATTPVGTVAVATGGNSKFTAAAGNSKFTATAAKPHHHHHHQFYNSYANPSAAC